MWKLDLCEFADFHTDEMRLCWHVQLTNDLNDSNDIDDSNGGW